MMQFQFLYAMVLPSYLQSFNRFNHELHLLYNYPNMKLYRVGLLLRNSNIAISCFEELIRYYHGEFENL